MTHADAQNSPDITEVSLEKVQDSLLATARSARAQRAAETIYGSRDTIMRQTMLSLLDGAELAEHDSPREAVLQVLVGRVRINGKNRSWTITAGQLLPIPPERHSVTALEDSVFLLTALRDA